MSDDLISRQAAIDALVKRTHLDWEYLKIINPFLGVLEQLPSAQPEDKEACIVCEGLESGDTLYSYSDWDGGIGFDYIHNIKYCPVCGRRLTDG